MSGGLYAFLPSVFFMTRTSAVPHAGDVLPVMPFLSLARELAALLVPVRPSQVFRDDLERSLMVAAREQNVRGIPAGYGQYVLSREEREYSERLWMIAGAAAVCSAVSIAGIVAYVLRRRERAA
jgi:hypothetical protein